MKKLTTWPLVLIAMAMVALAACTGKTETEQTVNNFRIKRGTNVSHWLSQSEEWRGAQTAHPGG